MKTLTGIFILLVLVTTLIAPAAVHAELDTEGLKNAAEDVESSFKELLGGAVGKAIFTVAMGVALIVLIFVPKARAYMIAVLIVGALIASYAGLTDALWDFFSGLFPGKTGTS
jgi:hypothetical protein